jgi:hypothetical protein
VQDGIVAQDAHDDGDVDMEDEEEVPKAKPKQRKPRKIVPVGRNGLKKKKVIRSRTTADEKGYMGKVVMIVGKRIYILTVYSYRGLLVVRIGGRGRG